MYAGTSDARQGVETSPSPPPTTRAELLAQLRSGGTAGASRCREAGGADANRCRDGLHGLYSAAAWDHSAASGISVASERGVQTTAAANGCLRVDAAGAGIDAAEGATGGDTAAEARAPNTVPSSVTAVVGAEFVQVRFDASAAVPARRRIVGKQRVGTAVAQPGEGCSVAQGLETVSLRAGVPPTTERRHRLTGRPPD